MKVRELIGILSKMDLDAEVCTKADRATSRTPWPVEGEGYKSSYGYTLPDGYVGFREAEQRGETFPVVWL